jgi:hypothetical protein
MSFSSESGSIRLIFDPYPRIAGGTVDGIVELDIQHALDDKIEDVKVKLRGSTTTYASFVRA